MQSKPKTIGQLRDFCASLLPGVAAGVVDPNKAFAVAKIAGRINDSFLAEAKVGAVAREQGKAVSALGDLPLGGEDELPSP